MSKWLERARLELAKTPTRPTANRDERNSEKNLTSLLAVRQPDVSTENFHNQLGFQLMREPPTTSTLGTQAQIIARRESTIEHCHCFQCKSIDLWIPGSGRIIILCKKCFPPFPGEAVTNIKGELNET